jgi:undecaprenyl diphosphate synthase
MENNQHMPTHIAVIMDGNRRWARENHLPEIQGHKQTADVILEPLIEHASDIGVKYMTFWAWSTENWNRSKVEITGIMRLFRHIIHEHWDRLHKKGVQIKIIGDISKFDSDIQKSLVDVVAKTKSNNRITAIFALNYGGRDEIIRAMNKAISSQLSAVSQDNNILAESRKLTSESFSTHLDTSGIPDPEIIVRPGGEKRLSGFMLWQSQYSELFFPHWYMPDFTPQKLDEIIVEFQERDRRLGR